MRPWAIALLAFGVVLIVGFGIAYSLGAFKPKTTAIPLGPNPSLRSAATTVPKGTAPNLDIRAALRSVEPGVVDIETGSSVTTSGQVEGEGTGMILDKAGHVLTNAHVVGSASTVSVQLFGQSTSYQAKVLGADTADDVAIVQIQSPPDLTPVPLGQSASVLVGDPVVAIGNALGLAPGGPTVTRGIISALDRTLNGGSIRGRLIGLIQTSAAINPGNSGGPLVDAGGQVIGMNTAVSTDGQNIGFAIPIDAITPLIPSLEKGTIPTRTQGSLGVRITDAPPPGGAQITEVTAGSPAAAAGLQSGDVITAIDDQVVAGSSDAAEKVGGYAANAKVTVKYQRNGALHSVTVTLANQPQPYPS